MDLVNKIGGSSLRNQEDFKQVKTLVAQYPGLYVISAAQGVTQGLLACLEAAKRGKEYYKKVDELISWHLLLIKNLGLAQTLGREIQQNQTDILALLLSVSLLKSYSKQQHDWLLVHGEYWSSKILAALLEVPWLDAGDIIRIHTHEAQIAVDWSYTRRHLHQALKTVKHKSLIVPGFVATDSQGRKAILGFNGSDFTAAIMARCLPAKALYKWTDIDGIYSADPKIVKSAFAIPELSYQESAELAYFGAEVLHPQAVQPAIEKNIDIYIKNFFNPEKPGTHICRQPRPSSEVVKGLSSIGKLALLNLEGTGFLGVSGMARRMFAALSKAAISVITISQASSEHSISVTIQEREAQSAERAIAEEFGYELQHGVMQKISVITDCAIVAAVGDNMCGTPGVAAKFFSTLAKASVNVLAIAQASSERNISAVIRARDIQRALRALHGGFYLSPKTLSIGLIGPGGVGTMLLKQINQHRHRLQEQMNFDLRVRGVMNSTQMLLDEKHIDEKHRSDRMKSGAEPADFNRFVQHIASMEIPHAVIIDCTSAQSIADSYPTIIAQGCHIVTPNKKANSGIWPEYCKLHESIHNHQRHYLYETTVCAGLPVIKTLKDLLATGDQIKRIEGIVSGTLSFIFHACGKGASFAEAVQQAYDLGYTEPDPREDLTGLDVARKFVCLARELGYHTELSEVQRLNLVPEALAGVSVAEFLQKLPDHQQAINDEMKHLLRGNAALAYVGIIHKGQIKIQLNAYPASHPFANTKGTDNIILIQSQRYDKQPLIIQGPGAGADVTAAGAFADLLYLVSML